ncbi:MAG: ankyrin repeat domain-containing protein [Kiloniellales bacterium]|nr:ankyrin repeat domain-containing protein [Kiloniellales bacterium]
MQRSLSRRFLGRTIAVFGLVLGVSAVTQMPGVFAADETELIAATKAGDSERVAQLLEAGSNPNVFDRHRNTALIFAARDGHYEISRLLIAAGADVNWQDGEEVTPLILAAHKNHFEIACLLLDHGAKTGIRDRWGRDALTYALKRGKNDPIARLINEARIADR